MSYELLKFLGLNVLRKEKKSEVPIIHRDTLKKRRDKKEKRDFVDKKELFDLIVKYKELCLKDKENDELSNERLKLRKILMINYVKIAEKLLKHTHFRKYPDDVKCDLLSESLVASLSIGKDKKNKNYGIEYFARFNHEKYDNVFAFWTQQIKNFYYMYLKKEYKYVNTKWESLEFLKDQFQYNCINIWDCPSAQFHYGDVVDYE